MSPGRRVTSPSSSAWLRGRPAARGRAGGDRFDPAIGADRNDQALLTMRPARESKSRAARTTRRRDAGRRATGRQSAAPAPRTRSPGPRGPRARTRFESQSCRCHGSGAMYTKWNVPPPPFDRRPGTSGPAMCTATVLPVGKHRGARRDRSAGTAHRGASRPRS